MTKPWDNALCNQTWCSYCSQSYSWSLGESIGCHWEWKQCFMRKGHMKSLPTSAVGEHVSYSFRWTFPEQRGYTKILPSTATKYFQHLDVYFFDNISSVFDGSLISMWKNQKHSYTIPISSSNFTLWYTINYLHQTTSLCCNWQLYWFTPIVVV